MVSKAHQQPSTIDNQSRALCLAISCIIIVLFLTALTAAYSLLDDSLSKPNARNVGYGYANRPHVTCLTWFQSQHGACFGLSDLHERLLFNSSIVVYLSGNQLWSGQLVKLCHSRLPCLRMAGFCFLLVFHTHCLLLNK